MTSKKMKKDIYHAMTQFINIKNEIEDITIYTATEKGNTLNNLCH